MLAVGQERMTGEDVGIPKREGPALDRLYQEALPGIVLQDQVGEKVVVGLAHTQLSSGRPEGLELEERIRRQQRAPPQGDGTELGQWQQNQDESCGQRREQSADHPSRRGDSRHR